MVGSNGWLAGIALALGLGGLAPAAIAQPASGDHAQDQGEQVSSDDSDERDDAKSGGDGGLYGEAEIILRYDSDVAVDELDLTSRQADEALRLGLELGYEGELSERSDVKLGYSFSQTSYEDFSTFDLQTHTVAASLSHDLGGARAGLSYRFIHARLDDSGLLDIHRVTPSLAGFVAPHLYARAELLYRNTNYLGRSDRDSEGLGGGIDLYLFLDGTRRYLSAGYDYLDLDANDPQFGYRGHTVRLGFAQRFAFGGNDGRLRLGWRYQRRDYRGITPAIGQKREDDRHRLRASLELPLNRWLDLTARYSYSDYSSNLPTVDYNQDVVDLGLRARF